MSKFNERDMLKKSMTKNELYKRDNRDRISTAPPGYTFKSVNDYDRNTEKEELRNLINEECEYDNFDEEFDEEYEFEYEDLDEEL